MEKYMKIYWAVVKFFAIFVSLEVFGIIALATIHNTIAVICSMITSFLFLYHQFLF